MPKTIGLIRYYWLKLQGRIRAPDAVDKLIMKNVTESLKNVKDASLQLEAFEDCYYTILTGSKLLRINKRKIW